MTVTWPERLAACRSEAEVIATCREWMATWSPDDLAALPAALRPGRIFGADDVAGLAVDAVRHDQSGAIHDAAVHRLARFFSLASARMAEVLAERKRAQDTMP